MFKIINKKDMEEIKIALREIYKLAEKQQKTNKEIYSSFIHFNDRISLLERRFMELGLAIRKQKMVMEFLLYNVSYKDNNLAQSDWQVINNNLNKIDKELEEYKKNSKK